MNNIKEIKIENGSYFFKLGQVLANKKISINKLMRDTNTDFKVIKRLMNGDIVKIDIIVLARICDYLECDIIDIVEYVRQSNKNNI